MTSRCCVGCITTAAYSVALSTNQELANQPAAIFSEGYEFTSIEFFRRDHFTRGCDFRDDTKKWAGLATTAYPSRAG